MTTFSMAILPIFSTFFGLIKKTLNTHSHWAPLRINIMDTYGARSVQMRIKKSAVDDYLV